MNSYTSHLRRVGFCFFLFFICGAYPLYAQSTVFNLPSTDVQPRQTSSLWLEFYTHPVKDENDGFRSYGFGYLYGATNKIELGFNAYYTKASGETQPIQIEPNAKWQMYNNEEKGIALAVGGIAFIPVTRRQGTHVTGMVYLSGSKQFKGDYAPRFTGGSYVLVGVKGEGETRAGAFAGYEQPLTNRVSFMADWTKGRNCMGYTTAGPSVTLTKRSSLYVGYSVGNQGRGNNYLSVFYGYNF